MNLFTQLLSTTNYHFEHFFSLFLSFLTNVYLTHGFCRKDSFLYVTGTCSSAIIIFNQSINVWAYTLVSCSCMRAYVSTCLITRRATFPLFLCALSVELRVLSELCREVAVFISYHSFELAFQVFEKGQKYSKIWNYIFSKYLTLKFMVENRLI